MAFSTITIGTQVFNSIGIGIYQLSTVVFGGASNLIKISGGKKASKSAPTNCSISRHLEKDITVGSVTTRQKCSVVLQIVVPEGFTTDELDVLIADISTFAGPATLTRILMGES